MVIPVLLFSFWGGKAAWKKSHTPSPKCLLTSSGRLRELGVAYGKSDRLHLVISQVSVDHWQALFWPFFLLSSFLPSHTTGLSCQKQLLKHFNNFPPFLSIPLPFVAYLTLTFISFFAPPFLLAKSQVSTLPSPSTRMISTSGMLRAALP